MSKCGLLDVPRVCGQTVLFPPNDRWADQMAAAISGREGGEDGRAAAASPLPCLNSNISNEPSPKARPKGGKKTGFKLTQTIKYMESVYGVERFGFLTITFPDPQPTPKEATRRMNILNAGVLSEHFLAWVCVYERGGKNQKPHFHYLVVCKEDIKTGANCDEIQQGNYKSANKALRAEWAFWRDVSNYDGKREHVARYGHIGRCYLVPVKSNGDGIRKYVGKYIEKHMGARLPIDKGVRLLRMSSNVSKMTCQFMWHSPGATLYRLKLRAWCEARGVYSLEAAQERFGPRFQYKNKEKILDQPVDFKGSDWERRYARESGEPEVVDLKIWALADSNAKAQELVALTDCNLVDALKFYHFTDDELENGPGVFEGGEVVGRNLDDLLTRTKLMERISGQRAWNKAHFQAFGLVQLVS